MRRTAPLIITAVLLLVGLAAPASAAAFSSYVTAITGVKPDLPGVTVTTVTNGESITVENKTSTPLVVTGYYKRDQVYRVTSTGTYYNSSSPSYKLNQEATIGNLGGPGKVGTTPTWVKINGSNILQWHDHRIHWMGSEDAPVVQDDPHNPHLVNSWTIPFTYGDTEGEITGTLSYEPGSRWGSYLIWGVIGLAVVATVVIQFVIRPRRKGGSGIPTDGPADGAERDGAEDDTGVTRA